MRQLQATGRTVLGQTRQEKSLLRLEPNNAWFQRARQVNALGLEGPNLEARWIVQDRDVMLSGGPGETRCLCEP